MQSEGAAGAPNLSLCPRAAARHTSVSPRPGSAPQASAARNVQRGWREFRGGRERLAARGASCLCFVCSIVRQNHLPLPPPPWCFLQAESLACEKRGRGSLQAPRSGRTGFPAGPRQRASMHPPHTSEPGAHRLHPAASLPGFRQLGALPPGIPPGPQRRSDCWPPPQSVALEAHTHACLSGHRGSGARAAAHVCSAAWVTVPAHVACTSARYGTSRPHSRTRPQSGRVTPADLTCRRGAGVTERERSEAGPPGRRAAPGRRPRR